MRALCLSLRSSRPGFTNPDVVGADSGFRVQSGAELRSASLLSAPRCSSAVMHRLNIISGHLSPGGSSNFRRDLRRSDCGSATAASSRSSPEDVVVVHGRRTAIGKAKRGGFKVSAGYLPTVAKVRPENHEVCFTAVFTVIFTGFKLQFRGNLI